MAELVSRPKAFWSYERFVEGPEGSAFLSFKWNGESGGIETGGKRFEIKKQGAFSGRWIVSDGGKELLQAAKPSSWFDRFEITGRNGNLELVGSGFIRRSYELRRGSRVVAQLGACPLFSSRMPVTYDEKDVDFLTVCFCVWLANLIWRRAANT